MAVVIISHEADAKYERAPITVRAGDELKIGRGDDEWPGWLFCKDSTGREGWVPEKYLKITGEKGLALQDYTAHELSAVEGEIVRVEKLESGWAWATSMTDETGWIPIWNLKGVD